MASLPKIQNAQYGDSSKLEQLGSTRVTKNPAADVQVVKDMAGGRPVETDPVKLAMRTAGKQQQGVDPEQQKNDALFNTLSVQNRTVKKWLALANNPAAGPFTRSYAMAVVKAYQKSLLNVRGQTAFFEED